MSCQCTGCDTCQSCNECQGCNDCLSFCEIGREDSDNGFSFSHCVSSGQIISKKDGFSRDEDWFSAIDQIKQVYNTGKFCNASHKAIPYVYDEYLKAKEFNRVAEAAKWPEASYYVYKGAVILGSYFETLEEKIAHLHYEANQCDNCNSDCNDCNECQGPETYTEGTCEEEKK